MGAVTAIEWTDATWNPIRARNRKNGKVGWHCVHVSEGCRNCYAEKINLRLGTGLPFKPGHEKDVEIFLDENILLQPLRWKKPRKIFFTSMTDAAGAFVPFWMLDKIFAVMALCPQHIFQVPSKRPERMRAYISDPDRHATVIDHWRQLPQRRKQRVTINRGGPVLATSFAWPLDNVWLGTSVEDQATADERIPHLLTTPAAIRFISAEPLLGLFTLRAYLREGWKLPQRTWGNFVWPAWVPLDVREQIEDFWSPRFGRGPDDWLRGALNNGQPPLGSQGDFKLCRQGEPLVAGRFIPAWNNIGRVVSSDGQTHVVSAGAYKQAPFLDWVITGYESGPQARARHPDLARSVRDQCAATGTPFLHKQNGNWVPHRPQAGGNLGGDVRAGRVVSVHPGGQSDIEVFEQTGGRNTVPGTIYMRRVGKKEAGNHLDGRQHLEFPR